MSSSSRVTEATSKIRSSKEEHDRWHLAAGGLSFNRWARRALNEQAALDEALRRQEQSDGE